VAVYKVKANKKLRRFVEGNDYAIRLKAEIVVDHFHEQVMAQNKIGCEWFDLWCWRCLTMCADDDVYCFKRERKFQWPDSCSGELQSADFEIKNLLKKCYIGI